MFSLFFGHLAVLWKWPKGHPEKGWGSESSDGNSVNSAFFCFSIYTQKTPVRPEVYAYVPNVPSYLINNSTFRHLNLTYLKPNLMIPQTTQLTFSCFLVLLNRNIVLPDVQAPNSWVTSELPSLTSCIQSISKHFGLFLQNISQSTELSSTLQFTF